LSHLPVQEPGCLQLELQAVAGLEDIQAVERLHRAAIHAGIAGQVRELGKVVRANEALRLIPAPP